MRVVLTGASSFTGSWFARLLLRQGHQVLTPLRNALSQYEGVRAKRLAWLAQEGVQWVEGCSFGDERFIALLQAGADLLCHHAATVENYKSMDFDVGAALAANTRSLPAVLRAARLGGVRALVLTGSVFEPEEGAGNKPLRAFSPYGLSKGLTWQVFSYWCEINALPLHKFVIPNPFGPWEEPRFCAHLMRCWKQGQVAQVNTPDYVRDNIHVDLLAMAYAEFVQAVAQRQAPLRLGPSGYVETQGAFATRFAKEIGARLGIATPLQLNTQTDFSEPISRINTDRPAVAWNEVQAWDQLAAYYRETYPDPAA